MGCASASWALLSPCDNGDTSHVHRGSASVSFFLATPLVSSACLAKAVDNFWSLICSMHFHRLASRRARVWVFGNECMVPPVNGVCIHNTSKRSTICHG